MSGKKKEVVSVLSGEHVPESLKWFYTPEAMKMLNASLAEVWRIGEEIQIKSLCSPEQLSVPMGPADGSGVWPHNKI